MPSNVLKDQPSYPNGSAETCDSSRFDDMQRPLLSFCLFAYNQEAFIREAVEGAFAQTYFPLEIILSDDCSTDNTFGIMEQMANQYEGPHKIILNRNSENLGLVLHVNRVFGQLSSGDSIIVAAGDDVSVPDRAEKLWLAWEMTDRKAKLISSGRLHINSESKVIGEWLPNCSGYDDRSIVEFIVNPHANFSGATAMYHRDVFNVFGHLVFAKVEDGPLIIRGCILGPVFTVADKLVKYRITSANMSGFLDLDYKKKMVRCNLNRISTYDQVINDLRNQEVGRVCRGEEVSAIIKACRRHQKKHELAILLAHESLAMRLITWLRMCFIVPAFQSIDNLVYLLPSVFYPKLMKLGLPTDSRLWKKLCFYRRNFLYLLKVRPTLQKLEQKCLKK